MELGLGVLQGSAGASKEASGNFMYEYNAKLIEVIDGDTVDLEIDLGFNVTVKERFRLNRINAPEKRGETKDAGLAATDWLKEQIKKAKVIKAQTLKDRKEKYGRYLVELFLDGDCVNDLMAHSGHAVYVTY